MRRLNKSSTTIITIGNLLINSLVKKNSYNLFSSSNSYNNHTTMRHYNISNNKTKIISNSIDPFKDINHSILLLFVHVAHQMKEYKQRENEDTKTGIPTEGTLQGDFIDINRYLFGRNLFKQEIKVKKEGSGGSDYGFMDLVSDPFRTILELKVANIREEKELKTILLDDLLQCKVSKASKTVLEVLLEAEEQAKSYKPYNCEKTNDYTRIAVLMIGFERYLVKKGDLIYEVIPIVYNDKHIFYKIAHPKNLYKVIFGVLCKRRSRRLKREKKFTANC